jgi:hypothetical protein
MSDPVMGVDARRLRQRAAAAQARARELCLLAAELQAAADRAGQAPAGAAGPSAANLPRPEGSSVRSGVVGWEFFAFEDGIVEVAREDGRWRLRVAGREATARALDEGLEALLGLSNSEIARLTIRILDWQARAASDPPTDERARLRREAASLRRLLAREESKARPDSPLARAARQLLAERIDASGETRLSG